MLRRNFDPSLPHRVVLYLRMSSKLQNERSPDQQQAEITKRMEALGYNWVIVKVYRDDAKSGRFLRNRSGYQKMLRDIKSGTVAVDLILVDTLERFGRVDELPTIRKELYERNGVLVLTGDSNFADPNTVQGRALGMFETMRATEHGRILGHNVSRGKRDTAQLKRWPGGTPPFGLMLESVMKTEKGRQVVDYSLLVSDPETSWIIVMLFDKAAELGYGTTRLARFFNEHDDIPDKFKPFYPETLGYWIDNPIYHGTLRWERTCTGIVDDMRVLERNPTEDVLYVADFCDPLVARELWEQVQVLREARRRCNAGARGRRDETDGKQIAPPAPGLTLNYLLSGLVYCTKCGRRMIANSTAEYVCKSGEKKRYTAYVCMGYRAGHCSNGARVPEEWLRKVVVEKIRQRLFPLSK